MTPKPPQQRITKRLVVSLLAGALLYWSLKVHRDWVWIYFESLLAAPNPTAEMASVATASINAITTAFIASSTAIGFIVAFFITGNVAALTSMFKWSSAAQATGEVVSEAVNNLTTTKNEVDEKVVQEYAQKYANEPSYRPIEPDTTEVFR